MICDSIPCTYKLSLAASFWPAYTLPESNSYKMDVFCMSQYTYPVSKSILVFQLDIVRSEMHIHLKPVLDALRPCC